LGIVIRQSFKGTVYIYAGAVVGLLSNVLFMRFLTPDQNGVLSVILSYAAIMSILANLGFAYAANRYFPYFRDPAGGNQGFLFMSSIISLLGFVLVSALYLLLREPIKAAGTEKTALFATYYLWTIPFTFVFLYFMVLENYSRFLYNSTTSVLLKEFFQRIFILASLLAIGYYATGFGSYIGIYWIACTLPTLMLAGFLAYQKNLHIAPVFRSGPLGKDKLLRKGIIQASAFGILTGLSTNAAQYIDTLMVNYMIGEYNAGIYIRTFYFATIIIMASRAMGITITLVAEAFMENNMKKLEELYSKSCLTQTIVGIFFFLIIWLNIDNIFMVLPEEYAPGKWIILLVGIGNLFNMATGINQYIIIASPYYKYNTYFTIVLLASTVVTNLIFIPVMGITGAALATMISFIVFNFLKSAFIYWKYKMQPYNLRYIPILLIGFATATVVHFFPFVMNAYVDSMLRCLFITVVYTVSIYAGRLSPDFNAMMDKLVRQVFPGWKI
jgi:O-antigen/teichoic acid export membrane protein